MSELLSPPTPRRSERGISLIEMTIFIAVMAPLFAALATTTTVFTRSAQAGHHRATANSTNHVILQRIAAELMQTSSKLDHAFVGNSPRPQPEGASMTGTNSAYNYTPGYPLVALGAQHETLDRDGVEAWHDLLDVVPGTGDPGAGVPAIRVYHKRRFFIYCTYRPFDTVEFQKVRTPRADPATPGLSHLQGMNASQPWSSRRKIFLEDGKVLLRVDQGDPMSALSAGPFKTVVLGANVEDLRFHVNAQGHFVVRLTTRSGDVVDNAQNLGIAGAGGARPWTGATVTTQIVVHPRNGLF